MPRRRGEHEGTDGMDILEIRRKAKARQQLTTLPPAAGSAAPAAPAPAPAPAPVSTAARTRAPVSQRPAETSGPAAPAPASAAVTGAGRPAEITDETLLEEFFASSRDAAIDRFTDPAFLVSVQSYVRADPDRSRYLACRIGSEEYGIDLLFTREIIKPVTITPVPRSPRDILGVISVRGTVLPVVDLALRLGAATPGAGGRDERFICLEYQGEGLCVRVDAVSHVVGFGANDIEPPPGGLRGISTDYIVGIGRLDERMIILLNVDEVIGGLFKRVW